LIAGFIVGQTNMNCWNTQNIPPIKTEPRGEFYTLKLQKKNLVKTSINTKWPTLKV